MVTSFSEIIAEEEKVARATARRGFVYFIRGDHPEAVKIGWTSDLGSRLAHLQTAMASQIMLGAAISGTVFDERALHQRFARAWMRGEWFRLTKPLRSKIERLRQRPAVQEIIFLHQPWQRVPEIEAEIARLNQPNPQ